MKIQIITQCLENYSELSDITNQNKQEYCRKHGYNFLPFIGNYTNGPFGFQRLHLIKDNLSKYDYIFWQGCDTLIMNFQKRIEGLVDGLDFDFFITKDVHGLNSDSFIIKNSEWSFRFLEFLIGKTDEYANDCWAEQRAMMHNENHPDFKPRILFLPQNSFNSYFYEYYNRGTDTPGQYHRGDFLLHLPGMNIKQRIEIFKSERVQSNIIK